MKSKWMVFILGAVAGATVGSWLLAPQPAGAVNRDMIELQQQVQQLLQGQQDLRSAVDSNNASLRTLVQQSLDSIGKLNGQMDAVQKSVQEVQANTGARIDSMTQQTQGISDNVQDIQARVGKLAQQLTDVQNTLQSIDSKVSGGATPIGSAPSAPTGSSPMPNGTPGPGAENMPPSAPNAGQPGGYAPVSADTLYQNALRDYTSGRYDLAKQEFSDYIRNFPSTDLASNSQYYLGEIAYSQNDFKGAVTAYNVVLDNYPKSFKLAASLLKRGMAELELDEKTSGVRDLRDVIRRFPGSDESRRAQAKLHEIGVSVTPRAPAAH